MQVLNSLLRMANRHKTFGRSSYWRSLAKNFLSRKYLMLMILLKVSTSLLDTIKPCCTIVTQFPHVNGIVLECYVVSRIFQLVSFCIKICASLHILLNNRAHARGGLSDTNGHQEIFKKMRLFLYKRAGPCNLGIKAKAFPKLIFCLKEGSISNVSSCSRNAGYAGAGA